MKFNVFILSNDNRPDRKLSGTIEEINGSAPDWVVTLLKIAEAAGLKKEEFSVDVKCGLSRFLVEII